jgi:glycosyltransferase involved in cell wall biosynthesis
LEFIRPRVARVITDSQFNARELEAIGYEDVRVIPPVVDPSRLVRIPPNAAITKELDQSFPDPVVLFVGQLLPHKRPDLLVEAMHVAATYFGLRATLLLVGQNRFARYSDAIKGQLRELNLPQVHVVGHVDDAQLAAIFRRAAAFVTVSEHEGFCVPLLEAMAFDVPVIARACAAIPETVGDGGLLLPRWAGAELIAEAIVRVVEDTTLQSDLVARGRRRLAELTAADASVAMLETIAEVV